MLHVTPTPISQVHKLGPFLLSLGIAGADLTGAAGVQRHAGEQILGLQVLEDKTQQGYSYMDARQVADSIMWLLQDEQELGRPEVASYNAAQGNEWVNQGAIVPTGFVSLGSDNGICVNTLNKKLAEITASFSSDQPIEKVIEELNQKAKAIKAHYDNSEQKKWADTLKRARNPYALELEQALNEQKTALGLSEIQIGAIMKATEPRFEKLSFDRFKERQGYSL